MKKLLVANRGEIALRIMRSAKEMGIQTVAVYSDADRLSPHVKYADEAILLGPGPSDQSYLLGDEIIDHASKLNVDAIHPGYGFLSENAGFAKKVTKAGMVFVGPSPQAIMVMGDKLASKKAVAQFGIPMVPGTGAIVDKEKAKREAEKIGYPVLIKAAAGGGGKGMRIVEDSGSFEEQLGLASSEAQSAFGDGSVFVEKYISSPRHIEIQVLADEKGNVVHLFERECSVQRRHQKVVEEAPSCVLTEEIRQAMGEAAINVAKACQYTGAGTVEFLYDKGSFYFLEMNTRLQVEHPVTELITGLDLVKEQIHIANGKKLGFTQEDLHINGHAIEIRVYAEDPENNFMPDIGTLKVYRSPAGPGVRVDDGYEEGMDIPIYYDPMLSKLIVHGKDRGEAIERMQRAIADYTIVGVKTTLPFCRFVLGHKAFVSGQFDTHFVGNYFDPEKALNTEKTDKEEELVAALLGALVLEEKSKKKSLVISNNEAMRSRWKENRLREQ